jgi:hypothetical protein
MAGLSKLIARQCIEPGRWVSVYANPWNTSFIFYVELATMRSSEMVLDLKQIGELRTLGSPNNFCVNNRLTRAKLARLLPFFAVLARCDYFTVLLTNEKLLS